MEQESIPPGTFLLRLLAVLPLVGMNGFFVAAEFALVGARASRLEQLAESGSPRARLARHMQSHLDRYIAASQLGITVASLLLGWLGEDTFAAVIEPPVAGALESILVGRGRARRRVPTCVPFASLRLCVKKFAHGGKLGT